MPATAHIHAGMTWLLRFEKMGTPNLYRVGRAGPADMGEGWFDGLTNHARQVR